MYFMCKHLRDAFHMLFPCVCVSERLLDLTGISLGVRNLNERHV